MKKEMDKGQVPSKINVSTHKKKPTQAAGTKVKKEEEEEKKKTVEAAKIDPEKIKAIVD